MPLVTLIVMLTLLWFQNLSATPRRTPPSHDACNDLHLPLVGLRLTALLPLPPKCWVYRPVPPHSMNVVLETEPMLEKCSPRELHPDPLFCFFMI